MKYLHILLAYANEPWAMERGKLRAVTQFLIFQAQGGKLTPEERAEFQAYQEARKLSERRDAIVSEKDGVIAVLPVTGVLMQRMNIIDESSGGTSTEILTQRFRALMGDPNVKAVVLDVDSPGGGVFGTQEFADEIYASRGIKPIIAQVNSMAASAAYWIASQADEIVVTPGGQAGSIGVYTVHEDISKAMAEEGVAMTIVQAGKYKTEGNPWEPLGDEARQRMQERVDEIASRFHADVARGRGVSEGEVLSRFGQGLMFSATELVKRNMADRIGTMADTLERFGVVLRPSSVQQNRARAEAATALVDIAAAGDRLWTPREVDRGLRGLGLSRSQAERFAVLYAKAIAPREPEKVQEPLVSTADIAMLQKHFDAIQATMASIPKLTKPRS
jgi:signal peptide peptidase SppA